MENPSCQKCSIRDSPENPVVTILPSGIQCCKTCFQIQLEYIFFAYHPESRYSGVDPNEAVHLIKKCFAKDWDVPMFASGHYSHDASDDFDPDGPFNHETGQYSNGKYSNFVGEHIRRYQELKLGSISFCTMTGHIVKNQEKEGLLDITRGNRSENIALRENYKEATEAHVCTLDVSDIVAFTECLRDPVHGGFNFDLKDFLFAVFPYWESKAKPLERPQRPPSSVPYLKSLSEQIDNLTRGEGGNTED